MATKAYFMIRIKEGLHNNGRIEEMIGELEAIPEVIRVEPIDGICDLLAQIEAPIRAVFAANKVMAKEWVKDLRMLKVESPDTGAHDETAVPKVLQKIGKHLERLEATSPATNAICKLKSGPSPGSKNAPSSRDEEAELERLHIHKEPLGSPTPYRSSLVEEAEKIIRRRR